MNNKWFYRSIAVPALIMLSMLSSATSAEECPALTATGNSEYPPYLWRASEDNNELNGAITLIFAELAKRLDRPISIKHVGNWSRAQEEVRQGRVDLIAGAFYTVPRNQWMDYVHPPFLSTKSVAWGHVNSPLSYQSQVDLIGRSGATVINNSFGNDFDEFMKSSLNINYVSSLEQAFKMLERGRIDFVLYELNPGLAYASDLNLKAIQPLYPAVSQEGLHVTLSHKSECNTGKLRGLLAKHIIKMTKEGFMESALQKGLKMWAERN